MHCALTKQDRVCLRTRISCLHCFTDIENDGPCSVELGISTGKRKPVKVSKHTHTYNSPRSRMKNVIMTLRKQLERSKLGQIFSLTPGIYYIQRRNVCHLPSQPSIEVEVHCQYHAIENASKGSLDPGLVALLIRVSLCTDARRLETKERTKTMRPRAYKVARMQLAMCITINVSKRGLTHQHPCRRRRRGRGTLCNRSAKTSNNQELYVRLSVRPKSEIDLREH